MPHNLALHTAYLRVSACLQVHGSAAATMRGIEVFLQKVPGHMLVTSGASA